MPELQSLYTRTFTIGRPYTDKTTGVSFISQSMKTLDIYLFGAIETLT